MPHNGLLKRVQVIVPYAETIGAALPSHRQEARRAMPMILNMVRSVTLLHQYQRLDSAPIHGGEVVATIADYAIARTLLLGPMGRSIGGGLPDAVVRFGQRLSKRFGLSPFTSNDALDDPIVRTKSKVNEHLVRLADAGVAECIEAYRGSKPNVWKLIGEVPEGGASWLPTPEQVASGGN
jgi:hypothetical protein